MSAAGVALGLQEGDLVADPVGGDAVDGPADGRDGVGEEAARSSPAGRARVTLVTALPQYPSGRAARRAERRPTTMPSRSTLSSGRARSSARTFHRWALRASPLETRRPLPHEPGAGVLLQRPYLVGGEAQGDGAHAPRTGVDPEDEAGLLRSGHQGVLGAVPCGVRHGALRDAVQERAGVRRRAMLLAVVDARPVPQEV